MSDISLELHQASLLRNKLLSRAVNIISNLQSDTDNLVAAAELHNDSGLHLRSALPSKRIEAGRFSAPTPNSTPVIKIPHRFRKESAASNANTDHAYQRSMHDAAEQRNLLLKRAYDVICNLQTDVDGLVEEVTVTSAASPGSPNSPLLQTSTALAGDGLTDIMRTAAATSAAAARLRVTAEKAEKQAREAEEAQQRAAEEAAKAARLAQQAEQRAMQEQGKGTLAAAVAASSTAARLRNSAAAARSQMRQLKAQAELKSRKAKDTFALACAAEQKAQALEAAGLAQAGPFSPLPYSPMPYSPQALQTPATLRGLAGGSGPGGKGWLGMPDGAGSQQGASLDFSAVQCEPYRRASWSRPAMPAPGNKQDRSTAVEGKEAQAQLLQATWAQLQEATAAAQHSQDKQANAASASQEAQQAAAEVAASHKAAKKAQAEVDKMAGQAARLKEAGRLEEAKKAQLQAKRWKQTAAEAGQAVAAAEQREKEAAVAAQAAASASFAAEAQADKLTGVVKQLQEATEAGAVAVNWRKKAHSAAQKAVEVRQQAEEHAAQASAADKRAAAAEQEAQLFEAQGKFADAAAAALQADRWHRAADDATKQAAQLQAESKAAATQSDAAQAAALQAKHLASRLEMATAHLKVLPSAKAGAGLTTFQSASGIPAQSPADSRSKGLSGAQPAAATKVTTSLLSRGNAARPTALTGSPSRLSRMTLQDAQTDEEEEPALAQPRADTQMKRTACFAERHPVMGNGSNLVRDVEPGSKPGLESQLSGNAEVNSQAARRSATMQSRRSTGQDPEADGLVSNASSDAAVPAWRSNSAAAWVKQKSFNRSLSRGGMEGSQQGEEEVQSWGQPAQPDQAASASPQAGQEEAAAGPGKGRALGSLHIEVDEEKPSQDELQDWTESGLDDIAAAVAQYTGASPHELITTTFSPRDQDHSPTQLLQQLPAQQRQRLQMADLHMTGSRAATQSPRTAAGKQYATQQEQMDAELDAAMAADAEAAAAPRYANAQEEMEAELEAAMAAEMGGPKYANAQEQMESELEAAMAADAAAGEDEGASSAHLIDELNGAAAADAAAGQFAKSAAPLAMRLYDSPKHRTAQMLELPGDGEGLDLDADGLAAPQPFLQQAETADMSKLEESLQKWQRSALKAKRHADACYAEAQAKEEEAAEAAAQAEAAQQETELLVEGGRHTDAEAATATAQRWVRRAAKAKQDGDAARAEADAKVKEAEDATAKAAQIQQSMEQQQQAPANPAQRSVPEEESSGSSMQASRQSEHRSFAVAGDEQAEQSVAADLMQEAAEATHQAELAQEEAEQLQGAGHLAEAAALSLSAHKWRKKAAKANRAIGLARAEGGNSAWDASSSPTAGRFALGPTAGHFALSPLTRPHAVPEWLSSPRSTPSASKHASAEPSSAALLPPEGHVDRADSISPGSLHPLNVFSLAGSRPVSSEASAEAAAGLEEEVAEGALREEMGQPQQQASTVQDDSTPKQEAANASRLLQQAAQWAKRNARALKLARRAQEAAAVSDREAAAAAEEAERASWQAQAAESEGTDEERTQALRHAATKWTKRAGKAQRAAARARAEAEAQEAEAAQAAQLAEQAAECHAQAEREAQAETAAQAAAAAAEVAAHEAAIAADTAAKARQEADSKQSLVSQAAGQAAAAWAQVEAMENKGDAAGAASAAAEAVALQQLTQQHQAAAEAVAAVAQQQEQAAAHLYAAAITSAQLAGTTPNLLQQLSQASQLSLPDLKASPSTMDQVQHMAGMSDQLPWQLLQQPSEQLADSSDEKAHASNNALPLEAGSWLATDFLRVDLASGLDSTAKEQQQRSQQQQQHQQGLGEASNEVHKVLLNGQGEDAAKAAYRQWSQSFEASRTASQTQEAGSMRVAPEHEGSLAFSPDSPAAAVISWDSFKSLAKPGDKLRLVGDSVMPAGDRNLDQSISAGIITPAATGLPLVTDADVAEWAGDISAEAQQPVDRTQPAGDSADPAWDSLESHGDSALPAWDFINEGDAGAGDEQMQWGQRLEAAGSQAEKLLVLAQEREQKAMGSTQRALELQQLATGSINLLEASQLSAAAQRCTAEAEEAAQVAALARAEAERLSANGPALGLAPSSPTPGLIAADPVSAAAMPVACPDGDAQISEAMADSDPLPAAAVAHSELMSIVGEMLAPARHAEELRRSSIEVVRGLSSDMQTAMRQLIASAHSSSSATLSGLDQDVPSCTGIHSEMSGTKFEFATSQRLPSTQASDLTASTSHQTSGLPDQAPWQIPVMDIPALLGTAATPNQNSEMPEQAHEGGAEGPSGMQLHLMHQLEGLERSVRRVEQQVSSTKQTRRRLKTASLPAQDADQASTKIPYLDGLPMEYWVVPPRTHTVPSPSLTSSLPSQHRSTHAIGSATRSELASSSARHALAASRLSYPAPFPSRLGHYPLSMPKVRLPMSAYATREHVGRSSSSAPKENWQEDLSVSKASVQLGKEHDYTHVLQNSN